MRAFLEWMWHLSSLNAAKSQDTKLLKLPDDAQKKGLYIIYATNSDLFDYVVV